MLLERWDLRSQVPSIFVPPQWGGVMTTPSWETGAWAWGRPDSWICSLSQHCLLASVSPVVLSSWLGLELCFTLWLIWNSARGSDVTKATQPAVQTI